MSVMVGTHINERVLEVFQEMKAHSRHRFIIARLTDDLQSVEIEYPPKPSPALKLATHMVNRVLLKRRQQKREASLDHGSDQDESEYHDAVANSIGPELAVLPPEIFTHVLKFCPVNTLWSLASSSKYWNGRITDDKDLWQTILDEELLRMGMGWKLSWEDMVKRLPDNDCRFAVFMWERSDKRFQPLFIIWSPDQSRIKTKMVYCSTAYKLKRSLDLAAEVQATSYDEITYDEVADTLRRTYGTHM